MKKSKKDLSIEADLLELKKDNSPISILIDDINESPNDYTYTVYDLELYLSTHTN